MQTITVNGHCKTTDTLLLNAVLQPGENYAYEA